MEKRITGSTGLLGLIGSPVSHSGSPAMYNYSFRELGLDYAYLAFDVPIEEVKHAIQAIKTFHMRGCNVTMPCKTEVVQYMDELSPAAEIIGAVNTIVNEDGKLVGHITDGTGFVDNLKDHGTQVKGKKITIAGGGGAATAVQVQCAVYDIEDAEKMKEEMAESDIFVNATIVGMKPMENETVVKDSSAFHKDLVVCDVVYNPIETRLLREAKEKGCKCIGGQGMLLWQGVAAFKLYTGMDMPVEGVKKILFGE